MTLHVLLLIREIRRTSPQGFSLIFNRILSMEVSKIRASFQSQLPPKLIMPLPCPVMQSPVSSRNTICYPAFLS